MKIVLIACASRKYSTKAKAKNLYISPLFKLGMKYAHTLNPDKIFILSAKYGLLNPETEIEPYNLTLNKMPKIQREIWAKEVLGKLGEESNIKNDEFIFLAGQRYREYLIPHLTDYEVPMQGLGIGKQLKFLTERLK
ncbi:MAG: DUF6884 domain-containing protein [archaeon]